MGITFREAGEKRIFCSQTLEPAGAAPTVAAAASVASFALFASAAAAASSDANATCAAIPSANAAVVVATQAVEFGNTALPLGLLAPAAAAIGEFAVAEAVAVAVVAAEPVLPATAAAIAAALPGRGR